MGVHNKKRVLVCRKLPFSKYSEYRCQNLGRLVAALARRRAMWGWLIVGPIISVLGLLHPDEAQSHNLHHCSHRSAQPPHQPNMQPCHFTWESSTQSSEVIISTYLINVCCVCWNCIILDKTSATLPMFRILIMLGCWLLQMLHIF